MATIQDVKRDFLAVTDNFLDSPVMADESFGEWLRGMVQRRGLSQVAVAKGLAVSQAALSRWLHDVATPDPDSCSKIAQFLHIPVEDVYARAGHPVSTEPPAWRPRSFDDIVLEMMAGRPVAVPVVDQLASAGPGQQVMDYVYLEPGYETDGRYVAIRVKGRSMEPELHDGDIVVLDTHASPEVGDTVVATIEDEVFVKFYGRKGDRVVLIGNDRREIPADDAKIEGVAIQTIRALRRR